MVNTQGQNGENKVDDHEAEQFRPLTAEDGKTLFGRVFEIVGQSAVGKRLRLARILLLALRLSLARCLVLTLIWALTWALVLRGLGEVFLARRKIFRIMAKIGSHDFSPVAV